jgi:hypothetical protein
MPIGQTKNKKTTKTMIANTKIEVLLQEGEKTTALKSPALAQIKKDGPITADDVVSMMRTDLFDSSQYLKVKEEVWGSGKRAPLSGNTVLHWMSNVTYRVYVTKK